MEIDPRAVARGREPQSALWRESNPKPQIPNKSEIPNSKLQSDLADARGRVQLGELVPADLMLFLEKVPRSATPATRLQFVESGSGIVLSGVTCEDESILRDPKPPLDLYRQAIAKKDMSAGQRLLVGLLDFRSEESGPELDGLATALGFLVMSELATSPHLVVLDRDYLQHLREEGDWTPLDQDLRTSVRLMEGGLRRTASINELKVTVSLRALDVGKPLISKCTVPVDDALVARDRIVESVATVLQAEPPKSRAVDRDEEADVFARLADLWIAWGDRDRAIKAAETAYALDRSQEYLRLLTRTLNAGKASLREMVRANRLLLEIYRYQAHAVESGSETNLPLPEVAFWTDLHNPPVKPPDETLRAELYDLEEQAFRFRLEYYGRHFDRAARFYWRTWHNRVRNIVPYFGGDPQKQKALLADGVEAFTNPPGSSARRFFLLDFLRFLAGNSLNPPMNSRPKRPFHFDYGDLEKTRPMAREVFEPMLKQWLQHPDPFVRFVANNGLNQWNRSWWTDRDRTLDWYARHQEMLRILVEEIPATHPYRKGNPRGDRVLMSAVMTGSLPKFEGEKFTKLREMEVEYCRRVLLDIVETGETERIEAMRGAAEVHLTWLDYIDKSGHLADALELVENMIGMYEKNGQQGGYAYDDLASRRDLYRNLLGDRSRNNDEQAPSDSPAAPVADSGASQWDDYETYRMDLGYKLPGGRGSSHASTLLLAAEGNRLYSVRPIQVREGRDFLVDLSLAIHWLPSGATLRVIKAAARIPVKTRRYIKPNWVTVVSSVALHGDAVYVSTQAGLVEFDLNEEDWKLLTAADGLPDNTLRAVVSHRGQLYVAGGGDLYDFSMEGPAVFGRYDPASGDFTVIASEKAIEKSQPWDGTDFQVDDMISDEKSDCIWIKNRMTGIWKYTPESETLERVAEFSPGLLLEGGRFVGRNVSINSVISGGSVSLVVPPDLTSFPLPEFVEGHQLNSSSVAAAHDGENVIACGGVNRKSRNWQILFIHDRDGNAEVLEKTPDGQPFAGATRILATEPGIVVVASDGKALLIRQKGQEEAHRFASLRSATGDDDQTALLDAASVGDRTRMEALVEAGTDMNTVDRRGWTPLHYALGERHAAAASYLIQRGADPRKPNERGDTPLAIAAQVNNVEAVNELLSRGAPVDAENRFGLTPLWYAIAENAADSARLLIGAGANRNLRDRTSSERTLLIIAAGQDASESIRLLLEYGASTETTDTKRSSPLAYASTAGNTNAIACLLDYGADVNAQNRYRWTPLVHAARAGHLDAIRLLVESGADLNAAATNGKTALMHAAGRASPEVVHYLIDHGADLHAEADFSWTPLSTAEWAQRHDNVRVIRQAMEKERARK